MSNGFGNGSVVVIEPDLGLGVIQPDDGSPEIVFSSEAVGGAQNLRQLLPGQPVRYEIAEAPLAGLRVARAVRATGRLATP